MTTIRIRTAEVPENSVLAEDIIWQKRRLIRRGSVLTKILLDLISRRDIQYIYIEQQDEPEALGSLVSQVTVKQDLSEELRILSEVVTPEVAMPSTMTAEEIYSNQYLRALVELNTEVRYGRVLASKENVDIVRELFVDMMKQEQYRTYLNKLQDKDHHTYLHAIDVFTLCVLFMRKLGLEDYARFGIGFLLHDVGKLNIPSRILKKQGKLTKPEFELMKRHTVDGYGLLAQMGAEQVAYLALSHHERADGSGYPQRLKLMQMPQEVRILQLMDIYSALTLPRVYRQAKTVTEAMQLLFQEKHLLDEGLLLSFVDFIGIYPEHSFVLLSDGSHAIVEQVNELCPLLPSVRVFHTGEMLTLPMDFQVTILKLLTYQVETPDELFRKFSDYLINYDEKGIAMYYMKLKEHYKSFEWFTHVYIPAFQIFRVLQQQQVIANVSVERGNQQLASLLGQTIKQLRQAHDQTHPVLIIANPEVVHENAITLLEGMLHTEDMYAIVLSQQVGGQELEGHLKQGHFSKVIVLGEQRFVNVGADLKAELYSLTGESLEKMLFHLASIRSMQVSVVKELEKYRVTQTFVEHM